MTFKKIVRTFALTSLLTLTAHSANAQDLLARQAPIDRRAKALDTMVLIVFAKLRKSKSLHLNSIMIGITIMHTVEVTSQMYTRLIFVASICQHQAV